MFKMSFVFCEDEGTLNIPAYNTAAPDLLWPNQIFY